jgi:transcriptional regulator ATRX
LEQTRQLKEKVLVFSQSLLTLDIIEYFLNKPQYGDWVPALDYYRLDGSTQKDIRSANMSEFNKSGNDRYKVPSVH